jgi:hypothetical protein
MILKDPKSSIGIVNLLADFILKKIPDNEKSIFQVADCQNFFIIKGKTTCKETIDLQKVLEEFVEKFSNLIDNRKITHSIDLIEYGVKLKEVENISFTYHNSKNCSYHYSQIDKFEKKVSSYDYQDFCKEVFDNLINTSSFPHGYSLDQGRLLYYFGKYVVYNIPSNYPITSVTLNLTRNEEEFSVYDNFFGITDDVLTSAILDMFDFDMKWLETQIKKVDWSIEITNPLEDYDFLKVKLKDFIII